MLDRRLVNREDHSDPGSLGDYFGVDYDDWYDYGYDDDYSDSGFGAW
jgi:hypothetical protein